MAPPMDWAAYAPQANSDAEGSVRGYAPGHAGDGVYIPKHLPDERPELWKGKEYTGEYEYLSGWTAIPSDIAARLPAP